MEWTGKAGGQILLPTKSPPGKGGATEELSGNVYERHVMQCCRSMSWGFGDGAGLHRNLEMSLLSPTVRYAVKLKCLLFLNPVSFPVVGRYPPPGRAASVRSFSDPRTLASEASGEQGLSQGRSLDEDIITGSTEPLCGAFTEMRKSVSK